MPCTSIRSFIKIGNPPAGPRRVPAARRLSESAASCSASGLSCVTRVQPGAALVERHDPIKARVHELDGGELPGVHHLLGLCGERLEIEHRRCGLSCSRCCRGGDQQLRHSCGSTDGRRSCGSAEHPLMHRTLSSYRLAAGCARAMRAAARVQGRERRARGDKHTRRHRRDAPPTACRQSTASSLGTTITIDGHIFIYMIAVGILRYRAAWSGESER